MGWPEEDLLIVAFLACGLKDAFVGRFEGAFGMGQPCHAVVTQYVFKCSLGRMQPRNWDTTKETVMKFFPLKIL